MEQSTLHNDVSLNVAKIVTTGVFSGFLKRHARHFISITARITITCVLFYALIEALARAFATPHLTAVATGLYELISTGTLQRDLIVTSVRWLVGCILGILCGVSVGLATAQLLVVRFTTEWFLTALRAVPSICLVPLSVRFFGYEEKGKYLVVAWAVFFVCWIGTHQARMQLPPHITWNARSLGIRGLRYMVRVILPPLRKPLFLVFRTALLIGLIVTAVAELAGSVDRSSGLFWSEGLGYRIFRSLDQARDDYLIAAILTFSMLGLAGELALRMIWSGVGRIIFVSRQRRTEQMIAYVQARVEADSADLPAVLGPALSVRNLTVRYHNRPCFSGLNLEVLRGETVALVGRSGCGKTSLLKSIAGFLEEEQSMEGFINLGQLRHGAEIGFIQQRSFVFDTLTTWQNLTISARFRTKAPEELRAALNALTAFGLGGLATREVSTLSGGERQRVAFATALLNRSPILLCDEPFASLDALTRLDLQLLYLNVFRKEHRPTVLWVTHDLEEAVIVADRVISRLGPHPSVIDIVKPSDPDDVREWITSDHFYHQVALVRATAGLTGSSSS